MKNNEQQLQSKILEYQKNELEYQNQLETLEQKLKLYEEQKTKKDEKEKERLVLNKMDLDEASNINMSEEVSLYNKKEEKSINDENMNNDFDFDFAEDKILFGIETYKSCLDFIEYIFDPSKQEEFLNISFINEDELVKKDLN